MKCTCDKWIEKIKPGQEVHVGGEAITWCPFCPLKLIEEGFRVHVTYDGPVDESKEEAIEIALATHDPKKAPGKKKLYFDLQP